MLSTNGKAIVNENGDTIILRGMGLGGWMLQEGYMLQTASFANAQHQIRNKIEELIGPANTNIFYDAWLNNHMRKIDVDSLKAWGFNSVRLPMHYNLYTLPIEEEPVPGENTWLTRGWELTDSLISWCAQNEMYVILDLHAAPGGQGYDQGISDYDPSKPSLWESSENKAKTVELWKRIAERYADEQWVAGYDLLNEPNWNLPGGTSLRNLYNDIVAAIRTVDTEHIIFIEGNWFANDFTGLTPPWDDNMVYSPHKYWSYNDQASIQWALNIRDAHNVPLYFGESGENSNTWFRDAIRLFEDEGIGFAWWPLKKVESISCPLSITKTPAYSTLLDYWENGGTAPSPTYAFNTLMELTENLRLENCFHQKDVADAIIRQVQSDEAIPYNTQSIPGIVYATDFDLGKAGVSYFDTQNANYHLSTGSYTPWNNGWQYRNDGVDIEKSTDNINTNGFVVGWIEEGEWMQYDVDVTETAVYDINVRVANGDYTGVFYLTADGAAITTPRYVPHTGSWQSWTTLTIPNVVMSTDIEKIRLNAIGSNFNLNSFEFVAQGPTTDLETEYLSSHTNSSNEIQLNLNKPLDPSTVNISNEFLIYADGEQLPIISATLNPDSTRMITFIVNHNITYDESLKMTYNGEQINAMDGTTLSTFFLEDIENREPIIHPIPGRMEAEEHFYQLGTQEENTSDDGGGKNIAFMDVGDYLDYYIDVTSWGTYRADYRTASESEDGGAIQMQLVHPDGSTSILQSTNFSSTGGWQDWETTIGQEFAIAPGKKHIRLLVTESGFNLNWIEFDFVSSVREIEVFEAISLFPNPTSGFFTIQGELKNQQDITIEIYNVLGQMLKQEKLSQVKVFEKSLDLGNFHTGNYILRIVTTDGHQKSLSILKR